MQYTTLPNTDLKVSRLCMGTMTFGSQVDPVQSQSMTDYCLDQGINFFDTANVYNSGKSEEILGACLGAKRKDVIVASKVRGQMPEYEGLGPQMMRRALEDSLRRLGSDYLDIYYLHQPDYAVPIEDTLGAMEQFRSEGKIRYGGTSNFSAWQICQILWKCKDKGYQGLHVSQPMYNVLARGIEQEYIPFCLEYGVGNVVYNPLAGGLLTGKQSLDAGPIAGTRFDGNKRYTDRYWHAAYFEAVQGVQAVAEQAGRSPLELSFCWLLQQPAVSSIILGASKMEHLEANLAAAAKDPLDEATVAGLDEVWQTLHGPTPAYNR